MKGGKNTVRREKGEISGFKRWAKKEGGEMGEIACY
jgi:hypothetical protein